MSRVQSRFDESLNKAIEREAKEINRRRQAPYDGLLGTLPEWAPEPLQHEFTETRGRLLAEHAEQDVREWLTAARANRKYWRQLAGEAYARLPATNYPLNLRRELEALLYIQDLVGLDKLEGLKAYNGTGAFTVLRGEMVSERNREIGRRPKKPRAPTPADEAITVELSAAPSARAKEIIRSLRTKDEQRHTSGLPRLFDSVDDPALEHRISRRKQKSR